MSERVIDKNVVITAIKRQGCTRFFPDDAPNVLCNSPKDGQKALTVTPLPSGGYFVSCEGCDVHGPFAIAFNANGLTIDPINLPPFWGDKVKG